MIEAVETHRDLADAERALATDGARFMGGGTLLMRAANYGRPDLTRIVRATDPAMHEVRAAHDRVTLGAGVTMAAILGTQELAFLHPAARAVGGPAIRQAATVGGNVCAHQPWGDLAVLLLALDARLAFAGDREPTMTLDAFLRDRHDGPRARTAARVIRSVEFARPRDASALKFKKVQRVNPKGTSVMTMAAHLPRGSGSGGEPRVALGNLCAITKRSPGAERALAGGRTDRGSVERACADLLEGFDPPTDALATGWYRREVAPVHFRRMLEER